MCGIWAFLSQQTLTPERLAELKQQFEQLVHRGPNVSRLLKFLDDRVLVGFHRLSIVDPSMRGMGPFEYKDLICAANAEIYNYQVLEAELQENHHDSFKSQCDTEVIAPLFDYCGKDLKKLCERLDGEFAFVIYDKNSKILYYATDEISMRPIFIGKCANGDICISSELISLNKICVSAIRVEAGGYGQISCDGNQGDPFTSISHFYEFEKPKYLTISREEARNQIREIFIQNVKDKIHYGTRDDGFFLSGGLDSSLVAGVAAKLRHPRRIKTFTVGFSADATDVIFARLVAKHIDSIHHEIIIDTEDAISQLEQIIRFLGSFDQTTIRASTPLYLATKWIKQKYPEIYIMYNGELADELLGGYLYFRNAPSAAEHKAECIRRLKAVHNYDGLRCDRVCSAFGIEARFPFFSKTLLDFVLSLPPQFLNEKDNEGVEKKLIREAFEGTGYIPDEVLWRTKNALSDATSVKSGWKDRLKQFTEESVSDQEFSIKEKYKHCTPDTKEDYFYREIFSKYYSSFDNTIPYKWLPLWCGDIKDSSASLLTVFNEDSAEKKLPETVEKSENGQHKRVMPNSDTTVTSPTKKLKV